MKGNLKPPPFNYDALYDAICEGNLTKVKRNLAATPSLAKKKTNAGKNILHIAAAHGQIHLFNYFAATYPKLLHMNTWHGSNILLTSAANGQLQMFIHIENNYPALLHEKSYVGWNPLHIAAANGQRKMFMRIARTHPDFLLEKDNDGLTVLHIAVAVDNREMFLSIAGTYPSLIGMKTKTGETALDMLNQTKFPDKEQLKKAASTVYELVSPKNRWLRESFACIIYAPQRSRVALLPLDVRKHIMKYLVGSDFQCITSFDKFYMKLVNMHLRDRELTHVEFSKNEVRQYDTSHITAAVEFMSGIIVKVHNDFAKGVMPAIKPSQKCRLQEWLSSTLIARGCEFSWLVTKDFRHNIMLNMRELLFDLYSKELTPNKLTVIGSVSKCVNKWVETLSNTSAFQKGNEHVPAL